MDTSQEPVSIARVGRDLNELQDDFNTLCQSAHEAMAERLNKGGAEPASLYLGTSQYRVLSRAAMCGATNVTLKRQQDETGSRFMFYGLNVYEVFAVNHLAIV